MIRAAAPLLVVALALSACQTTQELSAQRSREAKKLVNQKGLTVGRENPNVVSIRSDGLSVHVWPAVN